MLFRPLFFSQAGMSGASGGGTLLQTLTGNSGGAVPPTANNINTVGTGSITIAGNPGTSTLTTQLTGLTNHSLLVGAGTATITNLGVATNGQLPIGSTGADPVLATITAGTGISITNGAGSITIANTAGGFTWTPIGVNQTLAVQNGYFCTTGGALSLALPATSAVGDTIQVSLDGSTSWTITQPNAGTQIRIGNAQTTLGVGGSLASTAQGDTIELVCETANARWVVVDMIGNITVV